MGSAIISVTGLGKCYELRHESRHDTLRDTLAAAARRLLSGPRAGGTTEEFWALRDVSFGIGQGEVVGIIGRNGAGKSTLLKILSRIVEPAAGTIRLRGRVASLLEVGTGFHPELSGRENIYLNGAILGMSRGEIRRKFDEIVAFAEVDRFLDTPVKHYSSGMYVRLAFAVAAHLEPDILIIDEVLAVGDVQFQQKCLGKMESVARDEGRTILFVSHNISAVARFCPRVLLLDHGRLLLDGPTAAAINHYVSAGHESPGTSLNLAPDGLTPGAPLRLHTLTLNAGQPMVNRQPFTATLQFTADRPLPAGFGLGFSNIDGRRILTLESDYDGRLQAIPAGAQQSITLRLPVLDLIPGRYRVDVGAFGEQHHGYHYCPDCAIIDVQPGATTPPHVHGVYGDWRPPSDWRLDSTPATTR